MKIEPCYNDEYKVTNGTDRARVWQCGAGNLPDAFYCWSCSSQSCEHIDAVREYLYPTEKDDMSNFMETGEALDIVWSLAKQNALDPEEVLGDGALKKEAERQQLALKVVEDFIANNFGED
jgi:hypothetical protein